MTENLFEAQYDLTKKSKFRKFYESNKTLIFSTIFILLILFGLIFYYIDKKEKENILLSENYIQAKIYLNEGKNEAATQILKKVIFSNHSTYSTLSFFIILDKNLINENEIKNLFNHLLDNNKYDEETRNLLLYKKALFSSSFVNESELLKQINPLINKNTYWKPHALFLMGDYFVSKKEYSKAKDFFKQIIAMENISTDFHQQAKSRLININND